MKLQEKINQLELAIAELKSKVADLTEHTEEKDTPPSSVVGNKVSPANTHPVDFGSGKSAMFGGGVIWNDSELKIPRGGVEPPIPTKGYNKHTHSRYSGGALIKNGLEIIEYKEGSLTNINSQRFIELKDKDITVEENSLGIDVKKIGFLDLVFNADTQTWGTPAYEIDIKKCYLVERNADGTLATDSKGNQKKSRLWNSDETKTTIVWDENAGCFRFYATYAPGEE